VCWNAQSPRDGKKAPPMIDVETRDDWGFTEAEYDELHTLMESMNANEAKRILLDIVATARVAADLNDGWLKGPLVASPDNGAARMFPGGMRRELLVRLRGVRGELF
jgi:hypothetical protein